MPSSALLKTAVIVTLPWFVLMCGPMTQAANRTHPPEWLDSNPVSDTMVVNGLPTGARHLVSRRPATAVLDYFRDLWQCGSGEERCRLAALPPWQVLSRFDGRKLEYVQIRDNGLGATGYLAQSETGGHRRSFGADIPVMQGSRIVHDVETDDPGKQGRVLQVRNGYSVTSNSSYYQSYFMGRKWSQQVAEVGEDRGLLVFHKGRAEAHVVMSRQGGTTSIVINFVQ